MIITIGGLPGAGSTTVAQLVAKKLRCKLITVGELHKQIAAEEGVDSAEFDKAWKKGVQNPYQLKRFHTSLDNLQKQLAKREKNIVFNGKLSAFQIPWADMKIFLDAPLELRAERVGFREGIAKAQAMKSIKDREDFERREWKKIYGFDYVKDREVYDLVVNTAYWSAKEIAKMILHAVSMKKKVKK